MKKYTYIILGAVLLFFVFLGCYRNIAVNSELDLLGKVIYIDDNYLSLHKHNVINMSCSK